MADFRSIIERVEAHKRGEAKAAADKDATQAAERKEKRTLGAEKIRSLVGPHVENLKSAFAAKGIVCNIVEREENGFVNVGYCLFFQLKGEKRRTSSGGSYEPTTDWVGFFSDGGFIFSVKCGGYGRDPRIENQKRIADDAIGGELEAMVASLTAAYLDDIKRVFG